MHSNGRPDLKSGWAGNRKPACRSNQHRSEAEQQNQPATRTGQRKKKGGESARFLGGACEDMWGYSPAWKPLFVLLLSKGWSSHLRFFTATEAIPGMVKILLIGKQWRWKKGFLHFLDKSKVSFVDSISPFISGLIRSNQSVTSVYVHTIRFLFVCLFLFTVVP